MKNKGFTLIELLAVIVILAIIALIATPIVLGIIEDARKSANDRTAELIKSGVQNAYTSYMMAHNGAKPTAIFADATAGGFLNDTYYTVDSTDLGTNAITSGDMTCSVAVGTDANVGKMVITCSGVDFSNAENATQTFTATLGTVQAGA